MSNNKNTFYNENGNPWHYDAAGLQEIRNPKDGRVIVLRNGDVLKYVSDNKIWDGYHHPFNVLSAKKWIQFLKMVSKLNEMGVNVDEIVKDKEGRFKSDYEIATNMMNSLMQSQRMEVL